MKTTQWRTIRTLLAARPAAPPAAAESFWSDFRARAALHPQMRPERRRPLRPAYLVWAGGGVCATVLTMLVLHGTGGTTPLAGISSYEVGVPHGAVMILRDQQTDATILWVSELDGSGS